MADEQQKQIPCGNDRKKSKSRFSFWYHRKKSKNRFPAVGMTEEMLKQIPCGNDRKKSKSRYHSGITDRKVDCQD